MRINTHKHRSSMTFTMERIPFWLSFGAGAPARDPSPRNRGPSSDLVICAASLIVKGRTRTATLIEEAPSEAAMVKVVFNPQVAKLRASEQLTPYKRPEAAIRNVEKNVWI